MNRGHEVFIGEEMAIYVNGLFMTYVDEFMLRIDYDMFEIRLPQKDFVQNKKGMGKITGNVGGFMFSNYLLNIAKSQTQTVTIAGTCRNKKTNKTFKVSATDVIFTAADLANFKTGQEVKFALPFVAANVPDIESF